MEDNLPPKEPETSNRTDFVKELVTLINKYSMENKSNTPDWILAQYLDSCLKSFEYAVLKREIWYGRFQKGLIDLSTE